MGCIVEEDVRDYLGLQRREDAIFGDMNPTAAEITSAMKSAAREWNSIPPYVLPTDAAHLNDSTNVFFDAITMHLLMKELQKLTREDIDYTTGGVTTTLVAKRIAHVEKLIKLYTNRFLEAAKAMKLAKNLNDAFGSVG